MMTSRKDEWNALGIFQQIVCNQISGRVSCEADGAGWMDIRS
jgi:hypothetical protein